MKKHKFAKDQNQSPTAKSRPASVEASNGSGIDFTPSPVEVAKRAYFSFVSEGSLHGHDVQDWLTAEAGLVAEGKLSRIRGFYNSI
jgi:hypothetical protein